MKGHPLPEGHTIHRLARDLQRNFAYKPLRVSSLQERFAAGATRLDGLGLMLTEAHGKHLFVMFFGRPHIRATQTGSGVVREDLHVHLGLYGSFVIGKGPAPEPSGLLRLRLETDEHWADLRGASSCELVTPDEITAIHDRLGPDPLRWRDSPKTAWAQICRSSTSIGAQLMAQKVISGVGNVYRAEVLFRQRINPHRRGNDMFQEEFDEIWMDLTGIMRAGVRAGRIVTTRPEHRRRGRVRPEDAHYVYRRAGLPCRICGSEIRREVLLSRNLYWCPVCQWN